MNPVINFMLWSVYLISLYFFVFWLLVLLDGGDKKKQKIKVWKEWPLVSFAVPARNEAERIEDCLNSILSLDYPNEKMEILVVNDASTDNTREIVENIIKQNPDRNIVLINNKEGGKGKAYPMNQMLEVAKGEFFINFDADSYIDQKDVLKVILGYFGDENVAAAMPAMRVKKPKTFLQKVQHCEFMMYMFYKRLMTAIDCVHVVPGPFGAYRTAVLRKIGGFKLKNLVEDMEITFRIQKNHYKVIQVLERNVYTNMPGTVKGICKQRNRWFKGTYQTLFLHKDMALNKNYGDFGLIAIPQVWASGILSLLLFLIFIFYSVMPNVDKLWNLNYIGFDFLMFFKGMAFNFNFLDINYAALISSVFMMSFTIYLLFRAYSAQNDKVFSMGWIPLMFFMVIYYIFLGFIWAVVTAETLTGRYQKW